jgi:hypothetical protein
MEYAAHSVTRKLKPRKTWRDGEAEAAKWRERFRKEKTLSRKMNEFA